MLSKVWSHESVKLGHMKSEVLKESPERSVCVERNGRTVDAE